MNNGTGAVADRTVCGSRAAGLSAGAPFIRRRSFYDRLRRGDYRSRSIWAFGRRPPGLGERAHHKSIRAADVILGAAHAHGHVIALTLGRFTSFGPGRHPDA